MLGTWTQRGATARAPEPEQRYECKYVVQRALVAPMRQFVQAFARPDLEARDATGGAYSVCSLYLDTNDLLFYRQYIAGERSRFKLRARTYCDASEAPVFLEVKWRVGRLVAKQRTVLSRSSARDVIEGFRSGVAGPLVSPAGAFSNRLALTAARPLLRVKYLREAYVSPDPGAARVTFDKAIKFQPTFGPNLSHEGGRWTEVPLHDVVVEVKFAGGLPWWVEDMIRSFGLVQRPCCKYALAVDHMLANGAGAAVSLAGFVVPPSLRRMAS